MPGAGRGCSFAPLPTGSPALVAPQQGEQLCSAWLVQQRVALWSVDLDVDGGNTMTASLAQPLC